MLYPQQRSPGARWLQTWWGTAIQKWCWLAHWTLSTHLAADVVGQSKTEVLLVSETASPSLADIILGPLKQREAQGSPQQAVGLQAGATDSPVGTLSNASSWGTPTQASPLGVQGQRQLQAPVAGSSPGKLVAWCPPAGHGSGLTSCTGYWLGAAQARSALPHFCMNCPALSPSKVYALPPGKHEQALHAGLDVSTLLWAQSSASCMQPRLM